MPTPRLVARSIAVLLLVLIAGPMAARSADEGEWIDLSTLDAWKAPSAEWETVGSVGFNPKDKRKLQGETGQGIFYNGPVGKANNLISKAEFEDVEIHVEFLVPRTSNSGVKFQAVYEVQIYDSHGVTKPKGTDCGAVYPRSELKPVYHQIDEGHPPLLNASKPAGEWQTLDMTFLAPRFEAGKKVADAQITVILNGQVVQDKLKVDTPTGNAWHDKEKTTGPILLQGDHGPVAFRNLKARKLARKP